MTKWQAKRHNFYDPNTIQNEYLEKLCIRYPKTDCDPYKQERYRKMQEKPKVEKKWANYKGN